MKIQLDTEKRTIEIEEVVNLGDLFDTLDRLFPEKGWREYELKIKASFSPASNPFRIIGTQPLPPYCPYGGRENPYEVNFRND